MDLSFCFKVRTMCNRDPIPPNLSLQVGAERKSRILPPFQRESDEEEDRLNGISRYIRSHEKGQEDGIESCPASQN